MDYEKKYKEALERAKRMMSQKEIEYLFPELKESEDEKTRKELMDFIYVTCFPVKDLKKKERFLDWLEKRGEQKSAENVESKFKVGDFITNDYCLGKVIEITNDAYLLDTGQGIPFSCVNTHLWTIEDANDGDVLATENFIFIFKNIDDGNGVHYYCQYEIIKYEDDNQFDIALPQSLMGRVGNSISHYSPATKEQRNLLFQKMKEAGYKWDSEKKELKKIEQKSADNVEPKFHEGDWVLNNVCYPMQIASIKDSMYIFTEGDAMSVSFVDEHLHLWSIQDAEDGDVLINWNNTTFIFRAIEDETVKFHIAYNEKWDTIKTPSTKLSHLGLPEPQFEFHPATKEHRNLLFQKMKEAGYEWDAQKKEVKKSTDEVAPKFKVGNWYQCTKDFFGKGVTFDKNTAYYCAKEGCLQNEYGCHIAIVKDLYDNFKLWTIEDAKDGDVLVYVTDEEDLWIMIYWSLYEPYEGHVHYHALLVNDNFSDKGTCCICIDNLKPATKEQRDLLFQKMKEAGYKWDTDKKELKKDKKEIRRDEVKKNLQEYRSKTFSMKDLVDSFSAYIDKKCKNGPRRWLDADDKKLVIDAIKNGDWEVIFNLNEKYHE